MSAAISKSEEKCLRLFEQYVMFIETCSCHGNTHVYQVSFPCELPLASLKSEEVIFKKIAWGYVVV